jgi:hypothetical protein
MNISKIRKLTMYTITKKLVLSLCVLASFDATAAITVGNSQYQAKLYSEGLGRIPDQSGWGAAMNYWATVSCNATRLKEQGVSVLNSQEFLINTPSNKEKIFKLYRAALNRDPSSTEFNNHLNFIAGGGSWISVLNSIFGSNEFSQRASLNCSNTPRGWQPTLAFNQLSTSTGNFAGGDGSVLQAILNSTPSGGVVYLEQGAIVTITNTLNIPDGVTLSTIGTPGKAHAGLLGRLLRNSSFNQPLIRLNKNSKLKSVWVDGQKNRFGHIQEGINLLATGGNIEVNNNLISDSPGWTSFQYVGSAEGHVCSSGYVANNLITAYGSSHYNAQWTDGLSISCENTLVEFNEIIDATDVSIVVYRSSPAIQKSIVRNNYALNAGNSAYGGYVADPLAYGNGTLTHSFLGTNFLNNIIWSSPAAHVDIVLSNGTRPWFGTNSDLGIGAAFDGNSTGTQTINASIGISISGMKSVYVQNNGLLLKPSTSNCQSVNVAAAVSAGYASGDIQPYSNVHVQGCIGH